MTKKKMLAVIVSLLALSGVVGASLANAGGHDTGTPAVTRTVEEVTGTDTDNVQEGDQNAPDDPNEAAEEAAEGSEGPEADNDKHEDVGENADHQCPPDCDTANGETP